METADIQVGLKGRLQDNVEVVLVQLDKHFVFFSPLPFAPGAPIRISLEGILAEPPVAEAIDESTPLALEGRCIGCKRQSDGKFEVRARVVSLRKADRQLITSLLEKHRAVSFPGQ